MIRKRCPRINIFGASEQKLRSIFLLLGVCVLLAVHALPCTAGKRKVIVIVANRLTLDDLLDNKLANIQKMISNGSVGLISPNCIGYKGECGVMAYCKRWRKRAGGWFLLGIL